MPADAVAVTGLGCTSALAENAPGLWTALLAARSGIKPIEHFPLDGLRTPLAGAIRPSPELRSFAERERVTSRLHVFGFAALDEALADAGWDAAALRAPGTKAALVVGTSLGMSLVAPEAVGERLTEYDGDASNPDLRALAASFERRYSVETIVVTTACASAAHAAALALDMIRCDGYDVVVCGGADSLDRMKYLGHSALQTLTEDLPRPFSRARSGTLFGEGAGFLVLERAPRAPARYAGLAGAGYSTDVYHVTAPDPEGEGGAMAMRAALADAGLEPEAVDHVNLHGTGTPLNDVSEFKALAQVFGARASRVPCTSVKPAVGHAMGAAGVLEAIATILAIRDRTVPPTLNVRADEVEYPLDLVTGGSRPLGRIDCALSNSFGFGGANGTLVFTR
ncbi:MAG: 3-oxoacyl-[acyl-carrier-protein] synthase [Candidatus Eremiobacteraeota bacterium]|jgi:3-oxoacyl-(acyl-carrier-protein) synthase|nr:3-oxoacyl-[acyl-carrier-protein] synthase [Candidatus Eremiobacteraeota bacterium]